MEIYRWRIIQWDGSDYSGVDEMPSMAMKYNAKIFMLQLVGSEQMVEVEIPSGFGLVFIRRVQIVVGAQDLEQKSKDWKFIIRLERLIGERSGESRGDT